jgi:catechol 2,3-dioxygenase-like lactoylglutathione lyase family enzyme
MEQRISLVTIGVADVPRSLAFYQELGWAATATPADGIVFFQAGGIIVALWSRALLAQDSAVTDGGGWGGVTLAYNTRSSTEVDAVVAQARAAGATIGREPAPTAWGGYSGIFLDPDGHPWEIAHNPYWYLDDDGAIRMQR